MWALGYDDDDGGEVCFSEPFHGGRKLRPLVPRPLLSLRVNGANFSSQYYHLANFLNEESKREMLLKNDKSTTSSCPPVVVSSSRWNPTVEQLRILEELYRRGTRTPSADQIQHITAQLRRYGKIEGKNVFYWFQNHKARERQKRRRQTVAAEETKYSEKVYEIEETKTNCSWRRPPSKICSTSLSQECAKIQRRTKVIELEEEEEQKRREESVERDGSWNNNSTMNCQLINPTRKITQQPNDIVQRPCNGDDRRHDVVVDYDDGNSGEYSETMTLLQLFPLRSAKFSKYKEGEREGRRDDQRDIASGSDMIKSSTFSPCCSLKYFEFLPLKN